MYSVVILNYRRPDNIPKILQGLAESKRILETIISHGREDTFRAFAQDGLKVINRKDFTTVDRQWGVGRRFVAATQDSTAPVIVFVDDDIGIDGQTADALVDRHAKRPHVVHGIHGTGRSYDAKTREYSYESIKGDAPIVVTQCCAVAKYLVNDLLNWIIKPANRNLRKLLETGHPVRWNGEDIVLSLFCGKKSGAPNVCWDDLTYTPLDNAHAICAIPGHRAHRTCIIQAFFQS